MWTKLAVGAFIGLMIGHFVKPGYALWLVVGVISSYVAEVWAENARERDRNRSEA